MEIYYSPHNEIINDKAKVFIVGITPGRTQTSIPYKTTHDELSKNLEYKKIKKECKRKSRFAGSMRSNLIEMLDDGVLYSYTKKYFYKEVEKML